MRAIRMRQSGFSLIELMIAMVLGLLVIAAAGSMFFSNRRTYGTTEALNRIQENQRVAYEMMARDIREAGGNPCTNNVVNMLDTSKPGGSFYAGWIDGISGANGTGPNGSDEITLGQANGASISVVSNDSPSAEVGVTSTAGINDGDILMVCNSEVAAIFQATNIASGKIGHNSGTGTPGNLAKPFQITQKAFDASVGGSNAPGYCFLPGSPKNPNCLNDPSNSPVQLVKPVSIRWFLADNGRGGTSLYRQEISNGGANVGARNEIAEGVTNLQVTYKVGDSPTYVDASPGLDWGRVTAVRLVMQFRATQGTLTQSDTRGTDNATLFRTLDDYIVLRNHQAIQ